MQKANWARARLKLLATVRFMRPGGWEPDSAGQAPDAAIAGAGPAPLRRRRSSVSFTLPAAGSARVKRNWRRARMKLMTLVRFMEPIREQQELPAEEVGSAHHSGKASPRAEGSSRVSPRDVNPVEAPDSDPLGGAEASPPELAAHDRANARGASAEPAIAEAAPRFHVPLELSPALGGMHSMYSEYDEIETNRSGSLNQHTHRSGLSSTDDDSSTDIAGEVPDSYRSQESVDTEFALPAVSLEIMEWVKAATATTAQQLSEGGKPEPGWTARLGPSSPREDVEMLEVAATMTARLSNWAQRSQRRRSSAASNATHLSDEENAGLAEWIREHIRQERAQHEASLKQRRSMGGRTPQQRHGTGVSGSQAHDRDIQTEVAAMADWIKIRLRFLVMRKKQKQQQQQQQRPESYGQRAPVRRGSDLGSDSDARRRRGSANSTASAAVGGGGFDQHGGGVGLDYNADDVDEELYGSQRRPSATTTTGANASAGAGYRSSGRYEWLMTRGSSGRGSVVGA